MATAEDLLRIMTQMQASQAQQQLQHEQLMAQLIDQRPAPTVPRPAERPELRSELVPKFVTWPQFNVKAEQWEEFPIPSKACCAFTISSGTRRNVEGRWGQRLLLTTHMTQVSTVMV